MAQPSWIKDLRGGGGDFGLCGKLSLADVENKSVSNLKCSSMVTVPDSNAPFVDQEAGSGTEAQARVRPTHV